MGGRNDSAGATKRRVSVAKGTDVHIIYYTLFRQGWRSETIGFIIGSTDLTPTLESLHAAL